MKAATSYVFLSLMFFCASTVLADTFGSDPNTFDIDFVTIGNPGNANDTTGNPNPAGKVDYTYRMGQYEISEDMVNKANTMGGLGITQHSRGANKPTTRVTWFEAATFVNWLNTSTSNTPAYKFVTGSFQLWTPGDTGYDASNLFRNSQAKYFLPSTDEWYKAAYYNPITSAYYNYPTGSNSISDGIDSVGDTSFDAVFADGAANPVPNDIMDVGVASPYGTMGQGGNVWEMEESESDLVNNNGLSDRGLRGGHWSFASSRLLSTSRLTHNPASEGGGISFRVASIPEPEVLAGDFDLDNDVDGFDFLKWQRGESPVPLSASNLTDWEENFGTTLPLPAASLAVPEPSSLLLGAMATLALLMCRRR